MLEKKSLIPLSSTPSKKELKNMYPNFPEKTLRKYINDILKAQNKSIYTNTIDRIVFEKLIEQIGFPIGYTKEFKV